MGMVCGDKCVKTSCKLCRTCGHCNDYCPKFAEQICILRIKPPYVCNGCDERNKCTYEEALNKAKERLEEHEINTEFKRLDSLYGLTPETRERKRKYRQWLLDNGIGELSPDGDGVIMVETDRLLKALEQEGEIISRKMSKKQKN